MVLLTLLMLGCATPETQPAAPGVLPDFGDSSRFGTRPVILTPEQLHRLTLEQETDFLEYFNNPSRTYIGAHQRIVRYLEKITPGFRYVNATLSAAETYATNSGNCLSLAILTTALTKLAGIKIGYQLMDDQPVFEYQGNVVRKRVHISSIVYNPDWSEVAGNTRQIGNEPAVKIDYFLALKGRYIDNLNAEEYLAMYYSNIASDAIAANDYGTAYWYLLEAVRQVPEHSVSLNMLAVINRRVGDFATAEALYRYGILHANDKLSLLKNYQALLVSVGRNAEAVSIQQQLDTMNDPSPFHWLQLARETHEAGDWDSAVRYYRRALALAPYLHEAYLGLAQSYYAEGRLRSAESALRDAAEFANKPSTRTPYEAKLATLRQEF